MITETQISAYQRDGAIVLRDIFTEWVGIMAAGIERNLLNPGPYGSENSVAEGRFFDDYCNWQRIPEFESVIRESLAAEIAAAAMGSNTAQIFHDHVLVKEPGTPKETPWHQDSPYYFVEGSHTVSMWIPLDPVKEASLRLIAGSHKWEGLVRPVSWADNSSFYETSSDWIQVPDPDLDNQNHTILEWTMEPGDAVLFDFRTVHGARGNHSNIRRRALSLRWVGDDAVFVDRPGPTSPPYPGHNMAAGQRLREDWFPVIWTKNSPA